MSVNWLVDFVEEMPLSSRLRIEGGELNLEAADEIDRLRALITAWADADDAFGTVHADDAPERLAYVEASEALRKAVGR